MKTVPSRLLGGRDATFVFIRDGFSMGALPARA
jgi:hypothetical protein